jgi:hypothetical protein
MINRTSGGFRSGVVAEISFSLWMQRLSFGGFWRASLPSASQIDAFVVQELCLMTVLLACYRPIPFLLYVYIALLLFVPN